MGERSGRFGHCAPYRHIGRPFSCGHLCANVEGGGAAFGFFPTIRQTRSQKLISAMDRAVGIGGFESPFSIFSPYCPCCAIENNRLPAQTKRRCRQCRQIINIGLTYTVCLVGLIPPSLSLSLDLHPMLRIQALGAPTTGQRNPSSTNCPLTFVPHAMVIFYSAKGKNVRHTVYKLRLLK